MFHAKNKFKIPKLPLTKKEQDGRPQIRQITLIKSSDKQGHRDTETEKKKMKQDRSMVNIYEKSRNLNFDKISFRSVSTDRNIRLASVSNKTNKNSPKNLIQPIRSFNANRARKQVKLNMSPLPIPSIKTEFVNQLITLENTESDLISENKDVLQEMKFNLFSENLLSENLPGEITIRTLPTFQLKIKYIPKVNLKNFMKILDKNNGSKTLFNLLAFLSVSEINILLDSCKMVRNIIFHLIRENVLLILKENMKNSVLNVLELTKSYLKLSKIKDLNVVEGVFIMRLKINENKSFSLLHLSQYIKNNCDFLFKDYYTFDTIKSESLNNYWIFREYTNYISSNFNSSFIKPIIAFREDDFIKIKINLFSQKGFIDAKYSQIILESEHLSRYVFNYDIHNEKDKLFEEARICELEFMKNNWNRISLLKNYQNTVNYITNIFESNFIIENMFFDEIGYSILKVVLTANKKAKIINKEIGIRITILDKDDSSFNEVRVNNLIMDNKNTLEIKLGDKLIFYSSHK